MKTCHIKQYAVVELKLKNSFQFIAFICLMLIIVSVKHWIKHVNNKKQITMQTKKKCWKIIGRAEFKYDLQK